MHEGTRLTLENLAIEKSGKMRLCACLPVQSGLGLRIAGTGSVPVKVSRCSTKFIIMSFSMKVSRRVNPREPRSVSWTIPITGLLDCGDTTHRATDIISEACVATAAISHGEAREYSRAHGPTGPKQRGSHIYQRGVCHTSARVSIDCITCRFISSPSKSALYGVVTDRLRRKVE